ncbi:MAG: cbb3-type cytochrome c oxidase N-terminal domain-containing protein [Bacteroidota bacterium]
MKNIALKYAAIIPALVLPALIFAQEPAAAAAKADPDFWKNTFGILTLLGGAIVLVGALFAIVRLFSLMMKMEELRILREKGVEEIVEAYRQPQQSWWSKFLKTATKAVPVSQEQDIDLGHDYDGIRELDNRLPPWWLWMFYASIIFAGIYWFAFHMSDIGPSSKQEYEQSMEKARAEVAAYKSQQADAVDESTVAALTDANELSLGQSVFQANCVPCHGAAGEGNTIGPNLTDDYWLHGGGIKNLFKTINNGVIDKGMQSWKEQLRATDIQRVASYILTLKGTNPPNAKAPQGQLWTGEEAAPQDTTSAAGDKSTMVKDAQGDSQTAQK